jgi:hypothetical protein
MQSPLFDALMIAVLIIFILLLVTHLGESLVLFLSRSKRKAVTTRIAATGIGLISGTVGAIHSWFEFGNRNLDLTGVMFEADTGRSLLYVPSSDWTGWIAMTVIPDFRFTAILAAIMSMTIIVWSILFIKRKYGGLVLILLSVTAVLSGCGFIPPFMGIIGGVIGLRIRPSEPKMNQGLHI